MRLKDVRVSGSTIDAVARDFKSCTGRWGKFISHRSHKSLLGREIPRRFFFFKGVLVLFDGNHSVVYVITAFLLETDIHILRNFTDIEVANGC